MKTHTFLLILLSIWCLGTASAFSQEKLAQTGFQFLSVGTDARATAMGEAFTTIEGTPMALFYNPAGMARLEHFMEFSSNYMPWIADINYFTGALAVNPGKGKYGVFGVSFMYVDYGSVIGTVVANNQAGFTETGDISPHALMVGFGYARPLTDRFAVGGQVKYVNQSLGKPLVPETDSTQTQVSFSAGVAAFDFGTVYKTGFKSLSFGMSIRNFSQEISFAREGFELPLTFKIGFSIDAFDFLSNRSESQSLLVSFDAVNPRSYTEFFTIGGEYQFMNVFAIRGGYIYKQDDYGLTAGFGLRVTNINLDYSYTPFDVFDDVHRFSVKFSL